MKPSFKTTTLIAAIGMTFYAIHIILHSIPTIGYQFYYLFRGHPFWHDIYYAFWMYLLIGVLITAIVSIVGTNPREANNPKKSFRVITYVLSIVLLFATLVAVLPIPVYVSGVPYLFIPTEWRIIVVLLAAVWLWMLSRQNAIGLISKPLRVALVVGASILCMPILLQLISGISYLLTEYILFLRSWAIYSWTIILLPLILLCWYGIELFKASRRQQPK